MIVNLRKFYKRSLPKFAFQLLQIRISSVTLHSPSNKSSIITNFIKSAFSCGVCLKYSSCAPCASSIIKFASSIKFRLDIAVRRLGETQQKLSNLLFFLLKSTVKIHTKRYSIILFSRVSKEQFFRIKFFQKITYKKAEHLNLKHPAFFV